MKIFLPFWIGINASAGTNKPFSIVPNGKITFAKVHGIRRLSLLSANARTRKVRVDVSTNGSTAYIFDVNTAFVPCTVKRTEIAFLDRKSVVLVMNVGLLF